MIFTSLNFLLFFPSVVFVYYIIQKKYRWGFLLISSLFFYINIQPVYAILLLLISLLTYKFALLIEVQSIEKNRERILQIALLFILAPLFLFKYYNSVNEFFLNFFENQGIGLQLPQITLLLPIGISFYTFMAIGYIVDVYNEEIKAEKNIGHVILFLSFFPLVLSGPIERAKSMLPQFKSNLEFNYQKSVNGFQLMLWGYFMKLVVADRIAIYVNPILGNIDKYSGKTLLLATLLYPTQIYCDLGGYSLIAIGAASIMGINIRPNFKRPFFATSISELWRRWHISLISWILDYVYTPLSFALRKFKMKGVLVTIVLTLLTMGMWHGASLTFLMWAFYQGVFISLDALTKNKKFAMEQKYNLINKFWYVTLSILITYFIFSFSFLTGGLRHSFGEGVLAVKKILWDSSPIYVDKVTLEYSFVGLSMLFISEFRDEFYPKRFLLFDNKYIYIRWISYFTIIFIILLLGVFEGSEFIYFKF